MASELVTVIENAFSREGMMNMVFTTALDSWYGLGFWADVIDSQWSDRSTDSNMIVEFYAVIVDREDNAQYRIDIKTIKRGIRKAFADYRGSGIDPYQRLALSDLNFGKWDDADFDAITASIIVQYGLFGEVQYS
jgi:hypothetical protein